METKWIKCECKETTPAGSFQSAKRGKGMRLHNRCGGNKKQTGWRCTVCGKEKM